MFWFNFYSKSIKANWNIWDLPSLAQKANIHDYVQTSKEQPSKEQRIIVSIPPYSYQDKTTSVCSKIEVDLSHDSCYICNLGKEVKQKK